MMRRTFRTLEVASSPTLTAHKLRIRDITLRAPSKDSLLRTTFCSSHTLLAETIVRHRLLTATGAHIPFMQLAGTHLTFVNLLASALEGEERIETRFTGDEATVLADAAALGECRCCVRPDFNARIMEEGGTPFSLKVDRIVYEQHKPFSSMVNATLEELAMPPEVEGGSGGAKDNDGDTSAPPSLPYALDLGAHVGQDCLAEFFSHNITLHGYNYLRRSDGCIPALWLDTRLDLAVLRVDGLVDAEGMPTPVPQDAAGAQEYEKKLRESLQKAIPHSFGALMVPLAAGSQIERQVWQLQKALARAAASLCGPSSLSASPFDALFRRAQTEHSGCEDVLALMTGDYEGACAVAGSAGRQYSHDAASVAKAIEPIRKHIGIDDFVVPLAPPAEATRTGLDYFCRCSLADLLGSLVAASEDTIAAVQQQMTLKCAFCAKQHVIKPEQWAKLLEARAARQKK